MRRGGATATGRGFALDAEVNIPAEVNKTTEKNDDFNHQLTMLQFTVGRMEVGCGEYQLDKRGRKKKLIFKQ